MGVPLAALGTRLARPDDGSTPPVLQGTEDDVVEQVLGALKDPRAAARTLGGSAWALPRYDAAAYVDRLADLYGDSPTARNLSDGTGTLPVARQPVTSKPPRGLPTAACLGAAASPGRGSSPFGWCRPASAACWAKSGLTRITSSKLPCDTIVPSFMKQIWSLCRIVESSVSHGDDRDLAVQFADRIRDCGFRGRVQRAGSLVQHQDQGVHVQGTRDAQALALSA